ncbi:MAG: PsbP-related protein [Bacillota bacterium]
MELYIVYIQNYKKRLLYLSIIIMLWIIMFFIASFLFGNSLAMNLTIDNYLSFSYPMKYDVDNIYINETLENTSIQASHSLKKSITQKFSTYKSIKGQFGFSYPSAFDLNEQEFEGTEILYHVGLKDKSRPVQGFVQVWNLPYDLDEFLQKSKSMSDLKFKYFKSKAITVNNIPGFYWDYSISTHEGKSFKGSEVFLKKDEKMYRISYFVPEDLWNKSESEVFWNIVGSFKTY